MPRVKGCSGQQIQAGAAQLTRGCCLSPEHLDCTTQHSIYGLVPEGESRQLAEAAAQVTHSRQLVAPVQALQDERAHVAADSSSADGGYLDGWLRLAAASVKG